RIQAWYSLRTPNTRYLLRPGRPPWPRAERPNDHLGGMRHHQDRYGRDHDRDHMWRWWQSVPHGSDMHHPDDGRHYQGMDHDVAETDGKPRENLAKHRLQAPL